MAWKDTLQDASFRGVKFDCQRTEDVIDKEVARYAYPNVDGEDIQDLGLKAREVSITAVYFGDKYEDEMKALLSALSQRGTGELIHPVFGSLPNMQFLGGRVSHEAESVDACLLEMRFAAATPSNPFFVEQLPLQQADAAAQLANNAQGAGVSMFGKLMSALQSGRAGLRRLNALRDVLSATLGPIRNLVVGFRTSALDYLAFPNAFTSDLIGLVGGITDFRAFDRGLVLSDWNGLGEQMAAVVNLPAAAASGQSLSLPGAVNAAAATATPVDPAAPYSPARPSAVAATPADVDAVTAIVRVVVATVMAGVASDVLANEVDAPTLTPDGVEQIASDARTLLQSAIDAVRTLSVSNGAASGAGAGGGTGSAGLSGSAGSSTVVTLDESRPVTEALKDTALSIQQLAISVLDSLPPLITRTVDAPSSLTLLAFRWYGDYTRSAELLRLNPSIRNPNFIQRGDVLRAYAK